MSEDQLVANMDTHDFNFTLEIFAINTKVFTCNICGMHAILADNEAFLNMFYPSFKNRDKPLYVKGSTSAMVSCNEYIIKQIIE